MKCYNITYKLTRQDNKITPPFL